MRDLLGLAIDAAIVGGGLLSIGYTLWWAYAQRQRVGTLPLRAARVRKWRIVLGLCWGFGVVCFGGEEFLRHAGVGGFNWLVIPGFFAGVGFVAAMLMLADLGAIR